MGMTAGASSGRDFKYCGDRREAWRKFDGLKWRAFDLRERGTADNKYERPNNEQFVDHVTLHRMSSHNLSRWLSRWQLAAKLQQPGELRKVPTAIFRRTQLRQLARA